VLHRLLDLAGAHPRLRSNENFLALQDELAVTEDKIAYARQFYNHAVQRYNDAVGSLPGSLVAGRHREPYPYFELPDADDDAVDVRFTPRPPARPALRPRSASGPRRSVRRRR
jgi:LemA protein